MAFYHLLICLKLKMQGRFQELSIFVTWGAKTLLDAK